MRLKPLFWILVQAALLMAALPAGAQTAEQVKTSDSYIWAEGMGQTAKAAENSANAEISNQIRIFVKDKFVSTRKKTTSESIQNKGRGKVSVNSESETESATETYSDIKLVNCRKIVLENGGRKGYRILKYVEKAEINRMFEAREKKVLELLDIATRAEKELKLDDALKYYFWSNLLMSTLLRPDELYYEAPDGEKHQCAAWIPSRIDAVLSGVEFAFRGFDEQDKTLGSLSVSYQGKPVTSIEFAYYDGIGWSESEMAKNGVGAIEFRADYDLPKSIKVKIEYAYADEVAMDPEIGVMMDNIDVATEAFEEKAVKAGISLAKKAAKEEQKKVEERMAEDREADAAVPAASNISQFEVKGPEIYDTAVRKVLAAIRAKAYDSVSECFTPEGLDIYTRLIKYGSARVMEPETLKFLSFDGSVYCRSVPMLFSFSTNAQKFMENIVFELTPEGKISSLSFALENNSEGEITRKTTWRPEAKMVLVNFLENYKTSFALKRLDYIESIFSDDALIITGRVVQKTAVEGQIVGNDKVVEYTRQTKTQYIDNLKRSFKGKEYINLKFSNIDIVKQQKGTNPNIYTIQLRQDYYSSNYGDSGYLFLLVDVNDPARPIIHVRTWQPEPDPEFGIIGPGSDIYK